MTLDLFIVLLTLAAAFLGAFSGAAKQIAYWIALVVAWFAARGLGPLFGPLFAKQAGVPLLIGTVAASFTIFILVMVPFRYALKYLLRRILAGKDPENRTADRVLGFLLGAVKVLAIAYVILSALAFVDDNVQLAGRKLGISPKDSVLFEAAHQYNLFAFTFFSPVHDLVKVANAATDPKKAANLKKDPAYQALLKDPRFQQAVKAEGMKKAIDTGDAQALLKNANVLQLITDPTAAKRLSAVAAKTD